MDGTRIPEATALKGVGLGVYTPAEAARLIDVPSSTLRGWMTDRQGREPLWQSEHAEWDGSLLLSFRDLVEARVLNALRKQGFSTQQLRYPQHRGAAGAAGIGASAADPRCCAGFAGRG